MTSSITKIRCSEGHFRAGKLPTSSTCVQYESLHLQPILSICPLYLCIPSQYSAYVCIPSANTQHNVPSTYVFLANTQHIMFPPPFSQYSAYVPSTYVFLQPILSICPLYLCIPSAICSLHLCIPSAMSFKLVHVSSMNSSTSVFLQSLYVPSAMYSFMCPVGIPPPKFSSRACINTTPPLYSSSSKYLVLAMNPCNIMCA